MSKIREMSSFILIFQEWNDNLTNFFTILEKIVKLSFFFFCCNLKVWNFETWIFDGKTEKYMMISCQNVKLKWRQRRQCKVFFNPSARKLSSTVSIWNLKIVFWTFFWRDDCWHTIDSWDFYWIGKRDKRHDVSELSDLPDTKSTLIFQSKMSKLRMSNRRNT